MKPFHPTVTVRTAFLQAIVCALTTVVSVSSAPVCSAQEPAKPVASDASKAKERELLDSAFKSLQEELKAAVEDFQVAQTEANAKGLPRDQWPKTPAPLFYARFEALAMQDQADAQRWCIGVMPSTGFPLDEMISRKVALYQRYVTANVNAPFTSDIVLFLQSEGVPAGIGLERAVPLLDDIAKRCVKPDVRAQAMWTKAQLYSRSSKPENVALTSKSLREFIAAYPEAKDAPAAKMLLFQREHLAIGMTAPEVQTADVDGAAFKLSDTRGKVTVIVFFGYWRPQSLQVVNQLKALAADLKDKPFTVVGVSTDEDKVEFKKRTAELAVPWKFSWQGSKTGPWVKEWGIGRVPVTYVLDELGVIRFTNVDGQPLVAAVKGLIAEMEAKAKTPPK